MFFFRCNACFWFFWPRNAPFSAPIRSRYGHRSAFFQKFNRQRVALFEKIGNIKNWTELSVVKSFGLKSKKAAWKQRRGFWGRSSMVQPLCAAFPANNLIPFAVFLFFLRSFFGDKACKKKHMYTCEFLRTCLRNSQCELLQAWLRTCFKNGSQDTFCTTHEKAQPLRT